MKYFKLANGIILVLFCFLCETLCDLRLSGVNCGSKVCKSHEYCSQFDHQCKSCSEICDQRIHNYEPSLCMSDCQDYLHDSIYVRKDGKTTDKEDLPAVVQRLQYMVTVTLTLTCLVLLALAIILTLQICKWKKNNNITLSSLRKKFSSKKTTPEPNKTNGNGIAVITNVSGKPDLHLDMSTIGTQSEHSPATITTCISRRPAEDSALDYAYDNRAMSSSPSPNNIKPHESNF